MSDDSGSRKEMFANSHDFSIGQMKVVETDRSTRNIQTGGISVSNNNTYHPGSHHSNPVFYGNPDGSPMIVYYNHTPVLDSAAPQRHFGPGMRVINEQRQRPAPRPSQPRHRSYRVGEESGQYRPGPPPAPGSWQGQQQDPYEEYAAGSYAHYPQYEDPQYQDTHSQDPQYPQHSQGQYPPEQRYPHDQQPYSPSPSSDTNYPPASHTTHLSPASSSSHSSSPPHAQSQAYAPSPRASYPSDPRISNEIRRMQRQETYDDAPPQSPGFPPGQFLHENKAPGQQFDAAYDRRQEEERARGEGVVHPEEASPATPHARALAPSPTTASAPAPAELVAADSLPTRAMDEPQHQQHDHTTTTAPSDTLSGSGHSHTVESSSVSSTEKGKGEEKSKKRGSWVSKLFKRSSKNPRELDSGSRESTSR